MAKMSKAMATGNPTESASSLSTSGVGEGSGDGGSGITSVRQMYRVHRRLGSWVMTGHDGGLSRSSQWIRSYTGQGLLEFFST